MYNHYSTDSQYGINSYGNYTSPSNYGISSSHSSSLPSGLSSYTPYADSLTGTSSNYLTSSSSFMNKPLRTGERHHFDDSYLTKSPSFMPHSDSFRPIGGNLDSLKKTTLTVDEAEDFSVRTRRVSHDLGKPSNMYASQFVSRSPAPGGLGFGGLTGLGGLSSMGRTVEQKAAINHQTFERDTTTGTTSFQNYGLNDFAARSSPYQPESKMADLTTSFRPAGLGHFKQKYIDQKTRASYSSQDPAEPQAKSKQDVQFSNSGSKPITNGVQFGKGLVGQKLEFRSSHPPKDEQEKISHGIKTPPISPPTTQGPAIVNSDGSRPSNNNLFRKKIVLNAQNPQNKPIEKQIESRSPMPIDIKSDPVIPHSESPIASKKLGRQPTKADFVIGKKLGKGKFGQVYVVKHIQTGFICALKIIPKAMLKQDQLRNQIIRQLKIQCFLNHPNIANMYGYFSDSQNVYFLLELCCDGQLYTMMKHKKRLNEEEAKEIVKDIGEAADYLHRQRVIHRDLKLENIIMHEGVAKMCDFGWAVYNEDEYRTTFCFSPVYRPPELIMSGKYDEKVDIWALGILTYELLIGKIPFKINSQEDIVKICKQQIKFPEYVKISDEAKSFITSILQKDPKQRVDIDDILQHPFLKKSQAVNKYDFSMIR